MLKGRALDLIGLNMGWWFALDLIGLNRCCAGLQYVYVGNGQSRPSKDKHMTKTANAAKGAAVKGQAAAAKIEQAKLFAERKVHVDMAGAVIRRAVDTANAAQGGVVRTVVEQVTALGKLKAYKGCTLLAWEQLPKAMLQAAIADLVTVGDATKGVYVSNARLLFLATAHGVRTGEVQLSQAAWAADMRDKLIAKGVLPKPVEGAAKRGRPNAIKAGQGAAAKGGQTATTGAASKPRAVTVEGLQDMLRLAGMGEHTEQLAHLVLNERPVLIRWLDSMAD
jgi:hypothetical protein